MYKEISKRSFDLLFEKRVALFKVLLIPFVVLTIIENYLPTQLQITNENLNIDYGSTFFLLALYLVISVFMSISVHRLLLLSEDKTPTYGSYSLSKRFWSFLIKTLLIAVIMTIFALFFYTVFTLIGTALGSEHFVMFSIIVITIALLVLFSRLSLVFPATAIDEKIDFSQALALSKNHKLLVFCTVVLIPVALAAIVGFVYGLAIEFLMKLISQKLQVLYSLLNIFTTVFIIAFLSVTYEYIMSVQPIKEEESILEPEFTKSENGFKIKIDERYGYSFETLKKELFKQYEQLGFTDIKIDKEDSWMIKNPELPEAYVLLSHKDKFYNIETFNVSEEPNLI